MTLTPEQLAALTEEERFLLNPHKAYRPDQMRGILAVLADARLSNRTSLDKLAYGEMRAKNAEDYTHQLEALLERAEKRTQALASLLDGAPTRFVDGKDIEAYWDWYKRARTALKADAPADQYLTPEQVAQVREAMGEAEGALCGAMYLEKRPRPVMLDKGLQGVKAALALLSGGKEAEDGG